MNRKKIKKEKFYTHSHIKYKDWIKHFHSIKTFIMFKSPILLKYFIIKINIWQIKIFFNNNFNK